MFEELLDTYAILFTSSNRMKEDIQNYGELYVPIWLQGHLKRGAAWERLSLI